MKSMTGYGEATAQGRWAKIAVQLRTLNHRHLDIQLRVPRDYMAIEEEIRKGIRQRISRGRVDLFITRSSLRGQSRKLELDEGLLSQYLQSLRRARRKFGLKGEVDLSLFSSLPEIFQVREAEMKGKDEKGLVLRTLYSALKNLERSREREGCHLRLDIQLQIRHLRKVCTGLGREAGKIRLRLNDPLSLKEGGNSPEVQREAQEIGNLSFKGDIHEEVVRLKSHVKELARLIRERKPMGKRVDFLLQEIQRELNTISSKVPHLSVVQLVLAGKERVEKIREQAQNIE
ncbi:MAG: YicC family protein [Deltaproteobacteria bacterium]|nr:YicC family protein [Deltaproteobacteria bacterium]